MKGSLELGSSVWVNFFLVATIALTFGCGGSNNGNSDTTGEDPTGRARQIVNEYLKRDSSPYRKSRIRFTVTEEGEPAKIYEIESTRKQTPDETTTLTQIVAPPEEIGTSLAIESKGKKTVIVTYAESVAEFRETDSKKIFFGGLTAGELLGDWDKFNYQFIGEKQLNGVRVFDVEGKLKPDRDSVVSRMVVSFRAEDSVPAESHLFGADGKELRIYKTTAIKGDPTHPYASRVEVDNNVYKSHIIIEVLSQEYPPTIDDSMFTREKLKAPAKK